MSWEAVGLRILTSSESTTSNYTAWVGDSFSINNNNVVINYGVKSIKPIFEMNDVVQGISSNCRMMGSSSCFDPPPNCFLKSCLLCGKTLRLDEDVYMFRGDEGFCSQVCRDRQIYIEEMREIERRCLRKQQQMLNFRRKRCADDYDRMMQQQRQPISSSQKGRNIHRPPPIFTLS